MQQVGKPSFGKLLCHVSQRVQTNYIFFDNVSTCMLYLFCNVKYSKQLPNCLKIAETSIVLIVLHCGLCVKILMCCWMTWVSIFKIEFMKVGCLFDEYYVLLIARFELPLSMVLYSWTDSIKYIYFDIWFRKIKVVLFITRDSILRE